MEDRTAQWKGLRQMDFRRSIFSRKYIAVVIGVALVCMLSMAETIQAAFQYSGQGFYFSSLVEIKRLLTFDRYKSVLVAIVACLYSGSYAQDWRHRYLRNILSRVTLSEYVLSRVISVVCSVTSAVILGFILTAILLMPWMGVADYEMQMGDSAFGWLASDSIGSIFYLVLLGWNFGLSASVPAVLGLWISVRRPSGYVAIGGAVLCFYFMYAVSYPLPSFLSYEALSSNLDLYLTENPVLIVIYQSSFIAIFIVIAGCGFYKSLKKRRDLGAV